MLGHQRIPRELHPVAWWIWALGLAVAVNRTTNPLLLLLVLAVLGVRRRQPPQRRALGARVSLLPHRSRLFVVVSRVVFRCGLRLRHHPDDHILFHLPHIPTPGWYAGIQIGGPVSLEATLSAAVDGLRLGTMLCCIGAANALANPKRALRVLPGALYELGTAVVVSISVAPQLIESVQRVARARRLRGGTQQGLAGAAQHRDPGARGRAGPLAAARRGDGLARLRPHRARPPPQPPR